MKTALTLFTTLFFLSLKSYSQTECIWTGTVDSWWSNSGNWVSGIVPAQGDNVTIQLGTNDPYLDGNYTVGNVTIDSGATFFLESFELHVKGNWINHGTNVEGFSTVVFDGISHQQIAGDQIFYNMEVNNEAGAEIISGTISLVGILNVTFGNFYTNDSLLLISTPLGTGSIGPLTTGSLTGKITMQRYLSTEYGDWRFLSSPIENSTLNDISDDFWTAGFEGSTYPTSTFISVYFYDETVTGTPDYGYAAPSSITDTLAPGSGFMAYIDSTSFTGIIEFTGTPNQGTISAPVTFTLTDTISDGWNLVGNPYPSAINWNDSSIVKTNMYDAIYIWDPATQVYTSYVDGIGTNGGSSIIAAGQSFYVVSYDSLPVLAFSENCKTAGSAAFFKDVSTTSYFTMTIENSAGTDQTVLKSNPNATVLFDGSSDAIKMFSSNWNLPSVYSTDSENAYYSINQFPEEELEVLIYVNTGISEMHTMTFSGIESFENNSCVYLEDLHTGIVYDLKTTFEISVFISDTTSAPRFILKTGAPLFVEGYNATCYNADNGSINLGKNSNTNFEVNWFDQWGNLIQNDPSVYQIISLENLSAGTYHVQISDQLCGVTTDTILIEQPALISSEFSVSADTVYTPDGSAEISFTNASANANYFTWEFDNLGTSTQVNPTYNFELAGTFEVKLFAWQNADCYKVSQQTITVISTVGIDDAEVNTTSVYSYNQQLYVTGSSDYIEVHNLAGQLISSTVGTGNQTIIDLPLSSGQYVIVTIVSGSTTVSKKVFVG